MNPTPLSRRSFVMNTAGLVGAALMIKASNLFAEPDAAEKPLTFLTDKQAKKISEPGDYEVFKLNGRKILFARVSDKEVIALSAACTHEGCSVKYKRKENAITCWCHGSTFDLKGNVIKGPAKTALTAYPVVMQDGKIAYAGKE